MAKVHRHALVPFTHVRMFELVNDIERYPTFLPWCHTSVVHEATENEVHATLEIHRAGITRSFTTKNTLYPHHKMTMQLVKGPFKYLHGVWEFHDIAGQGCKVTLDLEFEFKHSFVNKAFEKIFASIADALVDAFCKEAKRLYGK